MTQIESVTSPPPKINSSHKFTDFAEEDNSTQDDHPPQNDNESQKKSFMKRPSENTVEGNAKKCKSFHPEPSTSGIHLMQQHLLFKAKEVDEEHR